MADLPSDKEIILNLLKGVAPERSAEIDALWAKYDPAIKFVIQRPNATMNADADRIEFDVKLIDVFWVLGYAAFQAIQAYTPLVMFGPMVNADLDKIIAANERFVSGERDFKEIIATARSFIREAVDETRWPDTIPHPNPDRKTFPNPINQAIYDLVLMALGFAWLHELRHVIFLKDGNAPKKRPDEELACDTWARHFVLDKISDYAQQSGHSYHAVYTKRTLAMSLAVLIIHMLTPEFGRFGDLNYPPIGDRMKAIIGETENQEESMFWSATACILIGLRRLDHQSLDFNAESREELVQILIDRMQT